MQYTKQLTLEDFTDEISVERLYFFKDTEMSPLPCFVGVKRANEVVSVVPADYKPKGNSDLLNIIIRVLDKHRLRYYVESMGSLNEPHLMICNLAIPQISFNDGRGDVRLTIQAHNSYDRTKSTYFKFGMFRPLDAIGTILIYKGLNEQEKKKGKKKAKSEMLLELNETAEEKITFAVDNFSSIAERVEYLKFHTFHYLGDKTTRIKIEKLMPANFKRFMAEGYDKRWRVIHNLYDLYMSCNYFVTHRMSHLVREIQYLKIAKEFYL
jgi:hypothetical protein